MLLVFGGEKVREYITAAEAARQFGLNRHYAARLAKKAANKEGAKWPVKKGRIWIAPIPEWEKIFNPEEMHIRKDRKKQKVLLTKEDQDYLISASEAGRRFKISSSWASVLAHRSYKNGSWPIKVGNMWLAPPREWENIFQKKEK